MNNGFFPTRYITTYIPPHLFHWLSFNWVHHQCQPSPALVVLFLLPLRIGCSSFFSLALDSCLLEPLCPHLNPVIQFVRSRGAVFPPSLFCAGTKCREVLLKTLPSVTLLSSRYLAPPSISPIISWFGSQLSRMLTTNPAKHSLWLSTVLASMLSAQSA